jgi:MFS family permease
MKKLLRHPQARRYLAGQAFSLYGDVALWLAMGIWVKELTGSSGDAGLTFFFFGLSTLLAPLSGMVVDRVKRRPLLIIANLSGALVVLALLFVHGRGEVWLIWTVAFAYGLVYTFLSSGQSALLATMLPTDMLVDANAFLSTVREGLRLFGPLTGAALFAVFGGGTVAVMDAATFLIAATALIFTKVEETTPVPQEQHWFAEVTAGARHLWRTRVLRQLLIAVATACLVFGFFESISFAVVSQGLHRSPTFLGVVVTVQGIGALAGGITSAKVIRRFGEGPIAGVALLMAASATLFFATHNLATVFIGAVILGVCLPWLIVALMTVLQTRTPNELQGRVSSAADTFISVPQTLSIGFGAVLLSFVNYRYLLFVICGVTTLAAVYLLTRPEQWERRGLPAAAEAGTVEAGAASDAEGALAGQDG